MAKYYINSSAPKDSDHIVHVETCPYLPDGLEVLGNFSTCQVAMEAARYFYHQANGCYWCCRACHAKQE